MSLIIEDGTGLINSESYIDVSFADAYFLKRGITEWATLTNREQLIVRAMDYIENNYTYQGAKLVSTQALQFPRLINGETVYPIALKNAVCELALKSNEEDLLADTDKTTIREKVGPLEIEYDPNQDNTKSYNYVNKLLAPYLVSTSSFSYSISRV
jgi:hypothetical protein